MITVLATIFVTLIVVGILIGQQRTAALLNMERARSADLYNKTLAAESAKTKAETELDFIKQSVIQLLNRQVVAAMSDTQVQQMTGAIIQYISTAKDPGKLN